VKTQTIKSGLTLTLCLGWSCCNIAESQPQWRVCDVNPGSEPSAKQQNITNNPVAGAIYLEANTGTIRQEGVSELSGNVEIQQDQKYLRADQASFDRNNNKITAKGNIRFNTENLQLKSEEVQYQLNKDIGKIKQAEYSLKRSSGRGKSSEINQEGKKTTRLKDATFTTCPLGVNSWHIASSNIKLNHETQEVVANNVTLKVGKVPIFYFPYFNFPLNGQRKSGLLAPKIGLSDQSGITVGIPYYFNLATNYDATVTPTTLSKRGIKLDTEFRYLTDKHKGIISLDVLPNDRQRNRETRSLVNIQHLSKLNDHTRLTINASDVSDTDYFDDLGESLASSSLAALERRIELTTLGKDWTFSVAAEDYQVLDDSISPYKRLPELKYRYAPKKSPYETKYAFEAELVNFEKKNSPTGIRLDLNTEASKRFGNSSWYIEPSIGLRHTQYSLDNTTTGNNSPARTLPTFSLDAGMFFERDLSAGKRIQTLEPRLRYTYTPFKNQNDIPLFDSADTSFGTSTKLFAANRFTGKDRIGDTNQLTAALSSRIIDSGNGREIMTASIGQIFYFDDRKVTLPGNPIETSASSELAMELSGQIAKNTRLITSAYWDPDTNKVTSTETRLHYKDNKKRLFNLGYRRLNGELEQAELSFSTPLDDHWSLVSRVDHDLKNDRNLERLAGVEYESCCWKTRLVSRRFLTSDNTNYDNAVYVEFELKGLGNLGTGGKHLLEERIYGYDDF
jgi:LPS-assembly protein